MLRGGALPLVGIAGLTLASCDVDKVQEGNAPEIEVTEEGQLPRYDVDAADVEVGTEKKEVTVPEITVDPPE